MSSAHTKKAQTSWILIDVGNSAFATTILAALFPVYLPTILPKEGVTLSLLGFSWQTSAIALWGYTVSISLLLTFFLSFFLSAEADRGGKRRLWLAIFTILGALSTMGLSITNDWKVALAFFSLANIGFGGSNIFYNALLADVSPSKNWHKISLQGYAWGYIGGGLLFIFNLLMILKHEWFGFSEKLGGIHASFISVGLWWLAFTLPSFFWIKERSDRSAPPITKHFKRILKTARDVWGRKNLLLFVIGFLFINDGISTVISMSTILGKESLKFSDNTLLGTLLTIQLLGLPFTLLMTKLETKWGALKLFRWAIFFWLGILVFAYFMKSESDFFILGLLVAVVLGVSQAIPRSVFALLTPPKNQAEYFSFYALTGKMASIFGPMLVGFVSDISNDFRLAILSLACLFLTGLLFIMRVHLPKDVE